MKSIRGVFFFMNDSCGEINTLLKTQKNTKSNVLKERVIATQQKEDVYKRQIVAYADLENVEKKKEILQTMGVEIVFCPDNVSYTHLRKEIIRRMYLMITIRSRLMTGTADFTFMNMQGGQTVIIWMT